MEKNWAYLMAAQMDATQAAVWAESLADAMVGTRDIRKGTPKALWSALKMAERLVVQMVDAMAPLTAATTVGAWVFEMAGEKGNVWVVWTAGYLEDVKAVVSANATAVYLAGKLVHDSVPLKVDW